MRHWLTSTLQQHVQVPLGKDCTLCVESSLHYESMFSLTGSLGIWLYILSWVVSALPHHVPNLLGTWLHIVSWMTATIDQQVTLGTSSALLQQINNNQAGDMHELVSCVTSALLQLVPVPLSTRTNFVSWFTTLNQTCGQNCCLDICIIMSRSTPLHVSLP